MSAVSQGRAKKSLGQNFLVDPNLQRKIVSALGADRDTEVLEIGPGKGALTRHLVGRVGRLVLVELDDALAGSLEADLGGRPDVEVVHGDILEVPLHRFVSDAASLRVIGNIPYGITTPIVFRLLERPRPGVIVLMVQAEVADRLVARVGSKAYGALSVGVRSVARAERLFKVGRRAFRPVPAVDSAVVRITPLRPEPITHAEEERLRRLVRAAFQWRRKQLGTTLRHHPDLADAVDALVAAAGAAGISLEERPERLAPDAFLALAVALP